MISTRNSVFLLSLVLCAKALLTPTVVFAQKMRITVGGAGFRPLPIAVPELQLDGGDAAAGNAAAADILRLLRLDIDMARHFDLVPPKTYLQKWAQRSEKPLWSAWQDVGASGVVRGEVAVINNQTRMTLHYDHVGEQKRDVLVRSCRSDIGRMSACVHQFVDALVQQVTGEPGIFSSRIAFVRQVGREKIIFGSDVDGGGVEKMVASGRLSLLPAWDKLGKYLLFTGYAAGGVDLFRLGLVAGRIEPLSQRKGINVGAKVSPDGRKIALTLSQDGDTEIYVMNWDGSNLVRLTQSPGQDVSPSWSPDGQRIAYVSSKAGSPQIYVMGADGKDTRRLTFRGSYNQEPDWSPRPDGLIAFTARDELFHFDIFTVHPDTGTIARLTQDAGDNLSPSHAPDGHHIAFVSSRGPSKLPELYVMDVDGKDPRAILTDITRVETPAWGPRNSGP